MIKKLDLVNITLDANGGDFNGSDKIVVTVPKNAKCNSRTWVSRQGTPEREGYYPFN